MEVKKRAKIITDWINNYCESASYKPKALVVGISGGIDSSAVLSYIHGSKLLDETRLELHKAFTLDFEIENKSEKHYAIQIANKYSIDHSIINCSEYINKNLPEIVEKTVYHSEQYGNLMIGPYLLYKSMSDEGYKVSVDGHGADELLGGYGKFMNDSLFDALIIDKDENEYTQLRDTWERFGMHVNSREALLESFSLLLKQKPSAELTSQFFAHRYQEFHDTTLPWILDTYDKIPMANGVEVRSPFLDWRLVTFSFGIPRSSLLRDGLTKKVLRDAVKAYLPIKVFNRTKKLGFGSPLKELLKKPQMVELIVDNCMSSDFINFSNFDGSKISADILKAIEASDFCKLVDLWPYVQLHILVSSLKRIQSD